MSKRTNLIPFGIFSVAAALSLGACDKSKGAGDSGATPDGGDEPTLAKAGAQFSEAAKTSFAATLAAYEAIRADLADDKIPAVKSKAAELAKSAQAAADQAQGAAKLKLDVLAKAAADLESKSSQKADDVRKAYGEVSRAIVNLVSSDPELKKDLDVYECPMAPGYKKWVQPGDTGGKLENPYMGQDMPECGGKSDWQE